MTNLDAARGREATFTARLLLAVGAAIVAVTVGVDWLKGTALQLGRIQVVGLGLGVASILVGVAVLRSPLVRRVGIRLWPFGADDPAPPLHVLAFALWLALASGTVEVGLRFWQFRSGQRWGTLNPHAAWMVPLVDAVTILLLAGALSIFAWRGFRHLGSPRLAAFLLLLLAIGGPLSLYSTELRWISVILLSLGIAFQAARWIVGRRERAASWVRGSAIPLVALVALAGFAPAARQAWSETRALAALPPPPASAPNVLLIVLDTVRAQNLSLHGYERRTTPGLERLAARATVFDRAYAPSSWTLPSHGSFFTAHPPHQQSSNGFTPLDDALPTVAEVLRDRGYHTFAVVANSDNAYPHTGLGRGFLQYDAGTATLWETLQTAALGGAWRWALKRLGILLPTRKDAEVVNERFLKRVDRGGERPFFAFLNYYDAHFPFDKPLPPTTLIEGWDDTAAPVIGQMDSSATLWVDEYDREIAYLDGRLEELWPALDRRGLLDHTILIVTSDHGEEFHEHGKMGHGWNVYNPVLHVPLLISYPGVVSQGTRVQEPVGLQDLPVTIVELAGVASGSPFRGTNILDLSVDSGRPISPILSELSVAEGSEKVPSRWNYRSLVWGSLHYIRNPNDSEEVYDLRVDPWEVRNLVSTRNDLPLAEFRAALSSLIAPDLPVTTATMRVIGPATGPALRHGPSRP